jgi:uncharacterized protein
MEIRSGRIGRQMQALAGSPQLAHSSWRRSAGREPIQPAGHASVKIPVLDPARPLSQGVQPRYIFYTGMEFEFDPRKSARNKQKHGIDFVEVQALWLDVDRVEIPARTVDEPRILVIGRIQNHHWSAVVTYRQSRIRIISARRSRTEEVEIYEGEGL